MYERKECPSCHCIIYSDLDICPICGYDFSSNLKFEEESCFQSNEEATAINFCPNCGKELNSCTNFCSNCGYKIDRTNANSSTNNQNNFCQKTTEKNNNINIIQGQYTNPPKSGFIAGILAFFLGTFGFHNFYLRRYPQGIIQLLISLISRSKIKPLYAILGLIIVYIWSFCDFCRICNGTLLPVERSLQIGEGQEKVLCIMRGLAVVGWIIIAISIFMINL